MKQFVRTYRFVKLARQQIDETESAAHRSYNELSGYQAGHAVTLFVKQKYIDKYKRFSMPEVSHICADAIKNRYLEGETFKDQGTLIDTLCLTTKGRKLLDSPFGTLQEFLHEYGLAMSFLTGSAVMGLVVLVWRIIESNT